MTIKFTSMGSMAQITMVAALQTLVANAAALSSAAESNDDSTERMFFRNFAFELGVQGSARTADDPVSLLIVPLLGTKQGSLNGDADDQYLAKPYIATDKDGRAVTWYLDADTAARTLTWANVCVPNSDYYVGILNGGAQAFAGTNEVWASSTFSVENVT